MPTFCRHGRLLQNCPICAREQDIELRPVVSPGGQTPRAAAAASPRSIQHPTAPARARSGGRTGGPSVRVRHMVRGADDGFRSDLAPGLRSSDDAARLAEELAYSYARLERLAADPPGLYAEVADSAVDLEERSWLAFLIAYLGPLEDADPFAAIERARRSWASGQEPDLVEVSTGPRGAFAPGQPPRALAAYRAWAQRAGSQAAAFTGEATWTPERRFARAFERLALPGLHRGARFDLLVSLGQTGAYELRAGALALGGTDPVTVAAKRLLGIGDPMLLERRAITLAEAAELPLAALDVAFYNWERGDRARLGMGPELEPDSCALAGAEAALGL